MGLPFLTQLQATSCHPRAEPVACVPVRGARAHLSQLTLSRLGRAQVQEMSEQVTGGKALPAEVVPLFVEKLTKTVLESGLLREPEGHYGLTGPLPPLAIPTTLQDSITSFFLRGPLGPSAELR